MPVRQITLHGWLSTNRNRVLGVHVTSSIISTNQSLCYVILCCRAKHLHSRPPTSAARRSSLTSAPEMSGSKLLNIRTGIYIMQNTFFFGGGGIAAGEKILKIRFRGKNEKVERKTEDNFIKYEENGIKMASFSVMNSSPRPPQTYYGKKN